MVVENGATRTQTLLNLNAEATLEMCMSVSKEEYKGME